ncbi:MAG: aspartyl-tRNA(Asn)/glutamyl-tRNA (Gln) amidotransferase subunit A [Parcubacteria group bacterium Licking1014_1]|nr:MAG: aspartyl-tRNA(Asn)/glutamyl-tRNA (Gln) amidotransferase subunit A [Parcubacteria group bacterium Licking1014_1]
MELINLTITQAHKGLLKKEFSAVELTRAYLSEIKKTDKEINAYLSVTEDLAMSQAEAADEKIASGNFGQLAGIPCAIKDAILVEGERCTAGSKILENYIAPYDATVVKKLKSEGAVILGKTNLDEFAMGGSGENSAFGPTKNPRDKSRVAGGSSSGSVAAVSAKEACYALGSDTGGSIRLPSSFCGVVGLKPTYGSVSRSGLIAFGSSLDQIGPITRTTEDCKIVFDAIKGWDENDSTSVKLNPKFQIPNPKSKIQNLRIGIPKEYFVKGINPEVEKIINDAIEKIGEQGARIEKISLPHAEFALACYYIIATSEASANLARFDGIKYGYSEIQNPKSKIQNLLDVYLKTRGQGFGPEAKRRIMLGTYSLSSGYYEAYYKKAQEARQLIKKDFENAFKKIDLIVCPVSPEPAIRLGEKIENPLSMYLMDVYTVSVNLAGLPAISLPVGKINDLPVGLQIIGNYFQEDKILAVAQEMEKMVHPVK